MESNSLDCKRMFNFYKLCLIKDFKTHNKENKIDCKFFINVYKKKCNNFIENENFNKLTYNDYN
jgi:hypothetical protein